MKKRVIGDLLDKGSMPTEILPDECGIEFTLGRSVTVCNCIGVLRFCETEVILKLKCGLLSVKGNNLILQSFGCGNVILKGKITGVDFC